MWVAAEDPAAREARPVGAGPQEKPPDRPPAGTTPREPDSLRMVSPRTGARRVVAAVLGLLLVLALCLVFVPWQQSVTGSGKVIVYSVMERPQNIEAQIPGRLVAWRVQEGQDVRAGELIAELADLDSKFLDQGQTRRLEEQLQALVQRREAAWARARALEEQLRSVEQSRGAAVPTAGERALQAGERLRASREALTAAEQSLAAAREVAVPTAREKAKQAEERLRAAEEALTAAEQGLRGAGEVGVPAADEKAKQAQDRVQAAREALTATHQSHRIAQEASLPSAREKARQAEDRRRAADQAVQAAKQNLVTARLNRERIRKLFQKTLRSQRDDELAELELVRAQTEVERAEAALGAADRDVRISVLELERAEVDVERARTEVRRAEAAVEIAQRDGRVFALDRTKAQVDVERAETEVERSRAAVDIARREVKVARLDAQRAELDLARSRTEVERARAAVEIARRDASVGTLDRIKVDADTAATLSGVRASLASARETIASMTSDILKVEVELQNVRQRNEQRFIRAPREGRVVRLMRVGAGETVKAGDVLAVLAPDSTDQAVELYLSDNDAPLVAEGRSVRLQFAGWPALQFSGWPSVAVGTYAGRVHVVDAIDDGSSRYRVIVRPDPEAVRQGRDEPWPKPQFLRPGAEVTGWVMLDTVPLGFELWRQFNAFPPTVPREPVGSPVEGGEKEKGPGEIKRKAGK